MHRGTCYAVQRLGRESVMSTRPWQPPVDYGCPRCGWPLPDGVTHPEATDCIAGLWRALDRASRAQLPIRDLDSLRMHMARTLAITPREPDPLDQVRWQDLLE